MTVANTLTVEDYINIARRVSKANIVQEQSREDVEGYVILQLWESQPQIKAIAWTIAKRARADWFQSQESWTRRHSRAIEKGTIVEIPTVDSVEVQVIGQITVDEAVNEYLLDEMDRIKYSPKSRNYTVEDTEVMIRMFGEGYSQKDISELYGLNKGTVQRIARRLRDLTTV